MRSEKEMMDLILGIAKGDERIRAVIMNGSRTNENVPKDCFQDYDIVYIVTELESFLADEEWIDVFGERIILQKPDDMPTLSSENRGVFAYLMLYKDGNRIDLTLVPLEKIDEFVGKDSLSILLMDKDRLIGALPPASDEDYHVQRPSQKAFEECCNEFWWVISNVAKGIWREELPYAMREFIYVRDMLDKMVSWYIGMEYNFEISVGKSGKYFEKYLDKNLWEMYRQTYASGEYEAVWRTVFKASELFTTMALEVANQLEFQYNIKEQQNVIAHLQHVRRLGRGCTSIYE